VEKIDRSYMKKLMAKVQTEEFSKWETKKPDLTSGR
jgi:hypothetical protein